jgi:hypothetical protein
MKAIGAYPLWHKHYMPVDLGKASMLVPTNMRRLRFHEMGIPDCLLTVGRIVMANISPRIAHSLLLRNTLKLVISESGWQSKAIDVLLAPAAIPSKMNKVVPSN